MGAVCGANCNECAMVEQCKGCTENCESPFGGKCIAKQYIRTGGMATYNVFKEKLRDEINEQLRFAGAPETDKLYELPGSYVNLEYELSNGSKVRFLKDQDIYLGCQVHGGDTDLCYGAVGNMDFILICQYGADGSNPQLITYHKR